MSLAKNFKISSKETYGHVFKSPDLKKRKNGLLVIARKKEGECPRLGIALKKKNIKLSVDRNFLKRKIKNSFLLHQKELPNLDYVFMSSRELNLKGPSLDDDISSLWKLCL